MGKTSDTDKIESRTHSDNPSLRENVNVVKTLYGHMDFGRNCYPPAILRRLSGINARSRPSLDIS